MKRIVCFSLGFVAHGARLHARNRRRYSSCSRIWAAILLLASFEIRGGDVGLGAGSSDRVTKPHQRSRRIAHATIPVISIKVERCQPNRRRNLRCPVTSRLPNSHRSPCPSDVCRNPLTHSNLRARALRCGGTIRTLLDKVLDDSKNMDSQSHGSQPVCGVGHHLAVMEWDLRRNRGFGVWCLSLV